ncbi:RNA ligase family protein [Saccharothrix syringae]|uniref:Kinase n=1 Tax=Saccharothrix syringae TaxID=103733 RepID=A0A5Q0H6R7_SACSY|nr:RNA ligase family protein [Saccharothrix syringae]QFZ21540.1 kinase [Saccharothrix syringae]
MRVPYPRTPHLPWSPGASSDDVRVVDLTGLRGHEVVVTEKLDGENTTLYPDGLHARSLDSAHHPSRSWVKGLHGRIAARLPAGWRVCGENVHARHSIAYTDLESWFYGFSVWDGDRCLGWDGTVRFLRSVGVPTPPVLWRGVFDERALRALRVDTERQEGFVVRTAEGFGYPEFGRRVAKWVRPNHVRTDAHWTSAPVVANGLGSAAVLWDVRSGAAVDVRALLAAAGVNGSGGLDGLDGSGGSAGSGGSTGSGGSVTAMGARDGNAGGSAGSVAAVGVRDGIDLVAAEEVAATPLGTGDTRLAAVLAAALHRVPRGRVAPLPAAAGVGVARRAGDLVGLHRLLHEPFPDDSRAAGLLRLSTAVDLTALHAVSAAVAPTPEARDLVAWSALHAEEVRPWDPLRSGLRAQLGRGPAADRCLAEARDASLRAGRVLDTAEAVAATWRWRSGDFPVLVQLVGLSGSGKSTFAAGLPGVAAHLSLDDLRAESGDRADQRDNGRVLRTGLARLDAALRAGGTVVWDATSLSDHQRSAVHAVARRHNALVTHAVVLVDERTAAHRNRTRAHPVPPAVLAAQARRFSPPYPWQAHRTWYVGPAGTVDDTDDGEP